VALLFSWLLVDNVTLGNLDWRCPSCVRRLRPLDQSAPRRAATTAARTEELRNTRGVGEVRDQEAGYSAPLDPPHSAVFVQSLVTESQILAYAPPPHVVSDQGLYRTHTSRVESSSLRISTRLMQSDAAWCSTRCVPSGSKTPLTQ